MYLTNIYWASWVKRAYAGGAVGPEGSGDCRGYVPTRRVPNSGWALLCSDKNGTSSGLCLCRVTLS